MVAMNRIENGYIIPLTGMEIIISDHCNISCRQCNHFAPVLPKWNVDPAKLEQELALLSKVYRPKYLKLIGGEPLLHPNLTEVVRAIKKSGISEFIRLVTNGMLLDRLPNDVWENLDELEISNYEAANLSESLLDSAREMAIRSNTRLKINEYPDFRCTLSSIANEDKELVSDIFSACKIANVWGCHALYRGKVYRCPQSIYIPEMTKEESSDYVVISNSSKFQKQLLEFLNQQTPLQACKYCLGTSGKKQPHKLLPRHEWRSDLAKPIVEMLDKDLLQQLLQEIRPADDCKKPMKVGGTPLQRIRAMSQSIKRRIG